jgi:hypothetical protein
MQSAMSALLVGYHLMQRSSLFSLTGSHRFSSPEMQRAIADTSPGCNRAQRCSLVSVGGGAHVLALSERQHTGVGENGSPKSYSVPAGHVPPAGFCVQV